MYFAQAYGLTIQSDLPLPELPPGGQGTDLTIQRAHLSCPPLQNTHIPRQGREAWFGGTAEAAYLHWPGVAAFKAIGGHQLLVDPQDPEVNGQLDHQLLNLYLLSEALGMVLFQRGLLLLHASAVCIGGGIVVFVGVPGAGKSTMAAALAQRGYRVLTDDMVAIAVDCQPKRPAPPLVMPGFPQIKIWPPTVAGLGLEAADLPPLFAGSTKQVIRPIAPAATTPLPLSHIFFLEPSPEAGLGPISKAEAMVALARFFPCPPQLLSGAWLARHFEQCDRVLATVPTSRLGRSHRFADLPPLLDQLIERVGSQPSHDDATPYGPSLQPAHG